MITLDIIGTIYTPVVFDEDDIDIVSGGEPLPGYHVNSIPAVDGWEDYLVTPATKRRVFAGMESQTCCYKFPDEQTFRTEAITLGLLQESEDEAI